ncbi:MAG TPA: alpha/beta hydrolase [Hanamia sp.]|nr:alpha/beta hydrolase [Hanamia sp.]
MPYISFQTKKIFYRIEGEGQPVFLLHGFAENGNIWNRQIEALKETNLLIVPDLPGSGNSEMLDWECNLKDYADVVKAIADEAIFKNNLSTRVCMIGHSMGGYITLAFAEKYPELLNSFGLFHSSAFADSEEKKLVRKKGIDFIKKNGTEVFLKTSIPNLFSEQTKKEKPELIQQLFELAKDIPAEALIQYYQAMILRRDRTSVLRTFKRPVLFIIGKHDLSVPLQVSLEQCYLPFVSVVHILENSAHMGMWEETELSNSFLKSFLDNLL